MRNEGILCLKSWFLRFSPPAHHFLGNPSSGLVYLAMRFIHLMVSLISFALAVFENLFTGWELPSSDTLSALDELNLDSTLIVANSANSDMFAFSDAHEFLAGAADECSSSSTFRSRQRRSEGICNSDGEDEEWGDSGLTYREMATNPRLAEQLSNLDEQQCVNDLPYLVCSSKNPEDTEWVTSLISFVCRNSARGKLMNSFFSLCRTRDRGNEPMLMIDFNKVGDTNQMADCVEPSDLFCCGTWTRNIDNNEGIPRFGVSFSLMFKRTWRLTWNKFLGTGMACSTWPS